MKTKSSTFLLLKISLVIVFIYLVNDCIAQENTPDGEGFERTIGLSDASGHFVELHANGTELDMYPASITQILGEARASTLIDYSNWNTFSDNKRYIEALCRKPGFKNKFYFIRNDGRVYSAILQSVDPPHLDSVKYKGQLLSTNGSGEHYKKILGDKLYVLESVSGEIESSVDNGVTWVIDTTGLGSNTSTTDFSLDTLQNIYAATSHGLYFQLGNSSSWNKIIAFPTTSPKYVFVDRKNKIWVVKDNKIYFSTDAGASWNNTTLSYYLAKLCDDVYGNIYGIDNAGYKMIRSTDGGINWTRIDQGITSLALDTTVDFGQINPPIINDVAGDSVLSAATAFGAFFSTDQGNTWSINNRGVPADNIQGYQQLSTGRKVITTALGVFIKNPSDTSWTQTYPVGKYFAVGKLWKDGDENLYIRGADKIGKINSVFKSVDEGSTWQVDTDGMHIITGNEAAFYVDSLGGQHLVNDEYPRLFYSKSGSAWTLDTTNMHLANYVLVNAFTDANGILYACGNTFSSKGIIMQRPLSSTSWSIDTVGMHNRSMNLMTHDLNGNPIAAGYHPNPGSLPIISYRYNNQWNDVAVPSSSINQDIRGITYDGTQGLMIYLQTHNFTYTLDEGHGIYCTHDKGATWNFVGLDSAVINQLESFGDTSFALSQVGLYKMTCNGVILISGIENAVSSTSDPSLYNYPNPFSESTNIIYSLTYESLVNVEVFDFFGRKISTLLNEKQSSGNHELQFSSGDLPSGIYFFARSLRINFHQ